MRRSIVFLFLVVGIAISSSRAPAQMHEPLDLFADAPKLKEGFVRLGAWNLRHINIEDGAADILPGATRDEDFSLLIATFAKAIDDLGLDIVAIVEHQPHPGEPNRLQQLRDKLNRGKPGPWKSDETNIEYDEPYHAITNPFGGLQFGLLWNTTRGVEIDGTSDRLLDELRQPRDEQGMLTNKKSRVPWIIPIKLKRPGGDGGLEFDLIVLHLKSGGVAPQMAEVDSLANFMQQHQTSPKKRHLVVCGDWNIRPDQDFQGQGRPRLKKMMVPTTDSSLMRILTVGDLRPTLQDWEKIDGLVGNLGTYTPLQTVLPYSHLPDGDTAPYTLLDHIAISRSLEDIYEHPLMVTCVDGKQDLQPGIQIARPLLSEDRYRHLTDHLPVVLTLPIPSEKGVVSFRGRVRIVASEPNPFGDEKQNESVHLKNVSGEPIDLRGWQIKDSAGVAWNLNEKDSASLPNKLLAAGETVIIRRNYRAMSLTNTGDSIILVDPKGKIIDSKSYTETMSGQLLRFE